jgi:hypothetical protein
MVHPAKGTALSRLTRARSGPARPFRLADGGADIRKLNFKGV